MNNLQLPSLLRSRRSQHGAVSLLVALMLLLGGTIMAFFANRSFIFEQRTSANQYRATKAFELAEAGIEWGLGKLNENVPLAAGTDCSTNAGAADPTFRSLYATPTAGGSRNVSLNSMPSCRIDAAGIATCICPTAASTTANHASTFADQGRFGVRFRDGANGVVEIIARGCTNGTVPCDPMDNAYAGADATAVTRVQVKAVPAVVGGPGAPLTAGSLAVAAGGVVNVVNSDVPSNGITINTGAAGVQTGSGINAYSLPGSPSSASIVDDDQALVGMTLPAEDARFASFLGQTMTNYRTVDPDVIRIGSCSAAGCGAQVMNVINSGVLQPRFFVDGDITFDSGNVGGSPIGTATNRVVVVSNGTLSIDANVTAHGLFHAAAVSFNGSGTSTIYGAAISRGAFSVANSATLNLIYDPSAWSASAVPTGRLVKVPGSWRDKATNF
jgi:hypothetical protein